MSVVGSQQLISKVYFPRLLVPLAAAVTPLVDFAIALVTLGGMMAWYRVVPGAALVWLPLLTLLAVATAFAVSLWLVGAERPLPRRALRRAVPDAVLAVRDAGRVSRVARAGAVAGRSTASTRWRA